MPTALPIAAEHALARAVNLEYHEKHGGVLLHLFDSFEPMRAHYLACDESTSNDHSNAHCVSPLTRGRISCMIVNRHSHDGRSIIIADGLTGQLDGWIGPSDFSQHVLCSFSTDGKSLLRSHHGCGCFTHTTPQCEGSAKKLPHRGSILCEGNATAQPEPLCTNTSRGGLAAALRFVREGGVPLPGLWCDGMPPALQYPGHCAFRPSQTTDMLKQFAAMSRADPRYRYNEVVVNSTSWNAAVASRRCPIRAFFDAAPTRTHKVRMVQQAYANATGCDAPLLLLNLSNVDAPFSVKADV